MQAGLGHLRLSPQAFWSMTLPELAAAIRGATGGGLNDPLSGTGLAALMAQFPDHNTPHHEDNPDV